MSDEHYKKYEGLIKKMAWRRVRRFPLLNLDEMVSQGNLGYCEALRTYDPEKGEFGTHLWWIVRDYMNKEGNRVYRKDGKNDHLGGNDIPGHAINSFRALSFKESIENLSKEARMVVDLILESSGELCDFTGKKVQVTQAGVTSYLRAMRWSSAKITGAIKEIKRMLNEL